MSKTWGMNLDVALFGESHGPAIGVVITGLPSGLSLDMEKIQAEMARRAPGQDAWSTARKEADQINILSGLYHSHTAGSPLCAMIENTNVHSKDYSALEAMPRPSHADLTAQIKYRGFQDPRGGGHFSGRITAALLFAGAVAKQYLEGRGITVGGHICQIGDIRDDTLDTIHPDGELLRGLASSRFPVISCTKGEAMQELIHGAQREGDSVGGCVQVLALGVPAGLGDPFFAGFESHFASLAYAIPAVKAVEFGFGRDYAYLRGNQANDSFILEKEEIRTATNHTGGINGGITNGMPVVARVTLRPTPSISIVQDTVDWQEGRPAQLSIKGRHDPCIVPRALPVVEAALALTVFDFMLEGNTSWN